jgi:hypothetical protein
LGLVADAAELGTQGVQSLICGAATVVATRDLDLQFILPGEGAAARFLALQSLAKNRLPAEVGLRLSSPQVQSLDSAPNISG